MTALFKHAPIIRAVTTRPVKARAMQFTYKDDCGKTREHVETIKAILGVEIHSSYDSQSGTGYHVKTGEYDDKFLRDRDWILKDSFGKVSVMHDSEFKVYYEPE